MCSIKKIHEHRLVNDIRHRSGMNVLLIRWATLPFFFLWNEMGVARPDPGGMVYTGTEVTVFVPSKSNTARCILQEAQGSAASPGNAVVP